SWGHGKCWPPLQHKGRASLNALAYLRPHAFKRRTPFLHSLDQKLPFSNPQAKPDSRHFDACYNRQILGECA
ncbi:hypothetical protein, partial [Sphingobium sp. SA916]|uniref:hypothetical protein n=1 Tax=Sphingobium sp. SA916 TaxID=1851207 RepID=UPI001C0F2E17